MAERIGVIAITGLMACATFGMLGLLIWETWTVPAYRPKWMQWIARRLDDRSGGAMTARRLAIALTIIGAAYLAIRIAQGLISHGTM